MIKLNKWSGGPVSVRFVAYDIRYHVYFYTNMLKGKKIKDIYILGGFTEKVHFLCTLSVSAVDCLGICNAS
jgi:hypothetical protein